MSSSNPLIAIAMERSLEMVIGLLGILKAGGAYVPIDPSYPAARIQYMLEDSAAPLLVTQSHLKVQLFSVKPNCMTVCLDEVNFTEQPLVNPLVTRQATDLAYVIYTSGSTGRPKGVMVEHTALSNFNHSAVKTYSISQEDSVLQFASISFDAAAEEIYPVFTQGGRLILRNKGMLDTNQTFLQTCQHKAVTILDLPTAYWQQLIIALSNQNHWPDSVRLVIIGGETASKQHIKHWQQILSKNVQLFNTYGPTEATVVVSSYKLTESTSHFPIGKPIPNIKIYILDTNHNPMPLGIPGELCIAGAGLARGYLNRPELTAEKFIEVELFGKTERIYKTGDKARWLPDGNLEYLGRIDHQVKLRGFRIELGEIEAALSQHEAVKEAVVTLYEANDNKRLVAYLKVKSEKFEDSLFTELKEWLKTRLPDYMVPSCFTVLDKLPLTPNGKIDRKALPAPEIEISTGAKSATPTEDLLANLWAAVLKCEVINRHDNFFELGGHSLLATQLIARIRDSFQVELPVRAVFEHPQLSSLAKAIETATGTVCLPTIEVQPADAQKSLSFGQEWFWFLNQYDTNSHAHTMAYAWHLTGNLDITALRQTASALVERHQSLRLCFPQQEGNVVAMELPTYDPLTITDLSEMSEAEQQLKHLSHDYLQQAFILDAGPLFRLHLVCLSEQKHVLLVVAHHIIFDDWSMGLLLQEWQTIYTAYHQQQSPQLPAVSVQYTDYAAWQRQCLQGGVLQQQLEYWTNQLQDVPELLKLPTDYPRPDTQQNKGGGVAVEISLALSKQLTQLARQHGCSLHMVLFSSFVCLLHRYSGQGDICVGVPVVMRHQRQTESMVGLFLNMLVLRTQVNSQVSFIDLLKQVRKTALDAYAHQDIPFEQLVNHLRPQRQTAYNPYFQVMFNLVNTPNEGHFELPELDIEPWTMGNDDIATSNLDIVFALQESAEGIHGSIVFDKALFKEATLNYWVDGFVTLLEQAVSQPEAPLQQFALSQNATQRYPLTSSQREIWFDQVLHDDIPLYNIGGYVKIPGVIDPAIFEQAINLLVQKHDTLRTQLLRERDEDGIPLQTYAESFGVKVSLQDFSQQQHSHDVAMDWMQQRFIEPFELTEQPLFRYDLVKTHEDVYYWLIQYHHLIVDGYGIALLNRSLAEIYSQLAHGQSPSVDSLSYTTFIENDRVYVDSKTFEQQRQYWLQKYPCAPEPLLSPRYRSQYTNKVIGSGCEALYLPRDFYNRLNDLAKQHKVSQFHVLLGTLSVYFTRTAQRNDFAIGLPVLNRANAQFKQTAGLFTGVSPALFSVDRNASFGDLLRQINKTLKANYRHQRFPVSEINREVGLELERSQLFDISLSYENHDYDASFDGTDSYTNLFLHPWEQTPLMIFVRDFHTQADVKFDFVYNHAYFNSDDIKSLQSRFVTILEAVLKNSVSPIHTLPIMTEQERKQLQAWNDTTTDYPKDKTIVDLFEQQVQRTPDNIAVVFEEQQLTYQQLNEKANQLAHYLLNLKTFHFSLLTSNFLVAIAVERSLEMVIGLLGILKAGGAYVPIDPSYPAARIQYMLEDSAAPLLVTQSHLKAQLFSVKPNCVTVCLDKVNFAVQPLVNPLVTRQVTDLAYVIYTSGSTGRPKGVMVEHASLNNLSYALCEKLSLNNSSPHIFSLNGSLSFDTSIKQVIQLGFGHQLVIIPEKIRLDALNLFQYIIQHHIETFDCTPQQLNMLVDAGLQNRLSELKQVWVAGELLVADLWEKIKKLSIYGFNLYGPTECTVDASLASISKCQYPTIGSPLANIRIYILGKQFQIQPPCIPGELCIAGAGLARGYLNRPELTAEKFIEVELFGKTERIYKTGDLARWLPDGNLEYLGRIDHQVKLRGFRIELGEIEAVLSQHEAVKEAVVTLFDSDDNKRLVAYLKVKSEKVKSEKTGNSLVTELKEWLKVRLPDYMVPSCFTVLDKLPLTPNGKIDRKALPAPELNLTETYEAPRNDLELQLAQIWKRLLKQSNISIHDNFFELGGDSILSIQIVAHARQAGLLLTPRDLFEHQTIAQLAATVRFGVATNAEQGLVTGNVPLTPIQHRFFAQALPEYWHFNQSILLSVPTDLKIEALRLALEQVLSHHDALRLRYVEVDGYWQQSVSSPKDILPFFIEDLSASEDPIAELYKVTQHYQTSLNLTEGPLTCLVFLQWHQESRLFWCIHHLVVDGVSWRILQEDLQTAYQQIVTKQPLQLPTKTSSFKAWAEHLADYTTSNLLASELAYWQALPTFSLPVDNPTGENRLEHHQNYTITLSCQATEALLRQVPAAYNTRINDILLTALALALADWTRSNRCLIDLEGHGRVDLFDDIDLSRTVGWFTTIHPVALTLPTGSDLGVVIKAIKEQLRTVPRDGIGYGLLTQLNGKVLPKGEVLFNYLGQFDQGQADEFTFANETTGSDVSLKGVRDHLIDINGAISQGQLSLNWSYSGECYLAETIEALAVAYQKYLMALIQHCGEYSENQPNLDTLLPLHINKDAQATLFCLPGLGSKAGYFLPFAKALDTTLAVCGLESPGLDGQNQIPETVEALAQHHLTTIRATQPNGPYYLIGHSFGAAVALEMAWCLEQTGETLALLAIFDQPTPQYSPEDEQQKQQTEFEYLWNIVSIFKELADIEPPFSLDDLKKTNSLNYACRTVMNWLKQENAHDILFSSKSLPEELSGLVKVYRANALAFPVYQPQDKQLRCTIDLFCTTESINTWGNDRELPDGWGWKEHTLNEVKIHQVTGSHVSMVKPPHVQGLADKLANILKRNGGHIF
ncbi:amino acid adenylation domain-containing protein [Candidatus Parabeggiatoa sp. HSG14]|uniref:non-ribosomal peptide synthetase n=1 Tax=Candidatus Parabeggiatoa sp. HSG14 TaxID=3055593 RepID=UPI0025A8D381|nr:amino acid adenylation domain-containing protein [Thiotrichales bacterium HSG14]